MALRFDGGRRDWAAAVAAAVAALVGGRARRREPAARLAGVDRAGHRSGRGAGGALRAGRRSSPRAAASATSSGCTARAATARSRRFSACSPKRAAEPDRDLAAPAAHAGLDEGLSLVARGRGPHHVAGQAIHVRGSAAPPLRASLRPPVPPTDDEIVREVGAYAKAACPRRRRRPAAVSAAEVGRRRRTDRESSRSTERLRIWTARTEKSTERLSFSTQLL